ncbi:MAG: xylose ABC transporter ATP-binding protein [Firmicutes bacterium HGW-Firmicutes-7]|nr:MAG: xylose ABC transporter ATP-binding protein [Firmicutes bacterium HGW-Firmicutes-7]
MNECILEMQNIVKEFSGIRALDDVTFKVKRGEIHALVGENGAGKSTLMKVLSGVYPHGDYSGKIIINDKEMTFNHIKDSEKAGVAIIYQELALVKQMNIAENIFLGNELRGKVGIDWNQAVSRTEKLLKDVGLEDNPLTKIYQLGIGKQQLIEIAKAIAKDVNLLILDEPTAALTETESDNLLTILRSLKEKGVTCIYISHKLNEVLEIADTITVLRDGKTICTLDNDEQVSEDTIITRMVGRELTNRFPRVEHKAGKVILEVENWTVPHPEIPGKNIISNVSFQARQGEILGIAGLMGAGRTELAMSLFGAYGESITGTLKLEGVEQRFTNPRQAIQAGFCYLTEDRKKSGLVLMMDIKKNITLSSLNSITRNMSINANEEIKVSNEYMSALKIKAASIEQTVDHLSGGNQQKVAIAKWLMAKPKVLILDEPTRGIDVGAKYEIYNLMNKLVEEGVCIIMISSELPEVLGMSDRVIVIKEGKITGDVNFEEADQKTIMYYATGGK